MAPAVLVVDDHTFYRETLSRLIEIAFPEATVVSVSDGSTALGMTAHRQYSCILLDYQLPGLSGGDVLRHLRMRSELNGQPAIPVVLMSTQPDVSVFTRSLGARAFLSKPTDEATLTATLRPFIEADVAQAAPAATRLWRIQPKAR